MVCDRDLSWEARGVLLYLLSRPDNWIVRTHDLVNQSHSAGRDKIQRILSELRDRGYLFRYKKRGEGGRIEWQSEVFESPEDCQEWLSLFDFSDVVIDKTITGFPGYGESPTITGFSSAGSASAGSASAGKHGHIVNTDSVNTDLENTESVKTEQDRDRVEDFEIEELGDPEAEKQANPTTLLKGPETEDRTEILGRGQKSSGGAAARRKTPYSETFEAWWSPYQKMCLIVSASAGNKAEAWAEWQKQQEVYESAHFRECDRLYREQCGAQMMQRGQVFGVAHGCRYLRSDKWQEAFDRSELLASAGVDFSDPNAVKQAGRQLEQQRVNDEVRELLAKRGAIA
jgi:hypothetical protein